MKLKPRHWELGRHYGRFVDRRWFPDYVLDAGTLSTFLEVESNGRSGIGSDALERAGPLLESKANRELTIRLLVEEMAEWWSGGNGWYAPIAHTLATEAWGHHDTGGRDRVYVRALIKIMRSCHEDGFPAFLESFPGLSQEEKQRHFGKRFPAHP